MQKDITIKIKRQNTAGYRNLCGLFAMIQDISNNGFKIDLMKLKSYLPNTGEFITVEELAKAALNMGFGLIALGKRHDNGYNAYYFGINNGSRHNIKIINYYGNHWENFKIGLVGDEIYIKNVIGSSGGSFHSDLSLINSIL